jgi:hypothetical protein
MIIPTKYNVRSLHYDVGSLRYDVGSLTQHNVGSLHFNVGSPHYDTGSLHCVAGSLQYDAGSICLNIVRRVAHMYRSKNTPFVIRIQIEMSLKKFISTTVQYLTKYISKWHLKPC